MGRGKLLLKRIEDKNNRHVTFSKRRGGLMKKAKELSVLCDVDVAVFVFSGKGKLYEFSTADSLKKIIQRFQMSRETDIACGSAHTTKRQINEEDDTNLLQAVQRYLEELKVEQLDVTEIPQLEHILDSILHQLKMKKCHLAVEAEKDLHEKDKQLRKGNQSTEEQILGPAMENENTTMACDNFNNQPQQPQEENNPLLVGDMEELYNTGIPLNLQDYML